MSNLHVDWLQYFTAKLDIVEEMLELIPLIKPFIGPEEEQAVLDTLRSGVIGTGPKTEQFEKEFSQYLGRGYGVGTNSCTAGLHLSLAALGVGHGDEVITTPITFVASANAIIYAGATPVFADVEPDTLNIDPVAIEAAITPHTKAIVPVHLFGHPCEMDSIRDIAKRHGLKVVGDCAHAMEAEYKGVKVGSLGDADCFSFYATKNLAMGNGGILVTDNSDIIERLEVLRDHGMSQGAWSRYISGEFAHFGMSELGFKYIMWDIPAAIGIQQLRRLEERYKKRVELAAVYEGLLEPLADNVQILKPRPHVRHAYHLFSMLLRDVDRDKVAGYMQAHGIGVGVHYRPVHLEPFYMERFGHEPEEFPVAEDAGNRLLSLPFWPELEHDVARRIASTLEDAISECRG